MADNILLHIILHYELSFVPSSSLSTLSLAPNSLFSRQARYKGIKSLFPFVVKRG